MHREQIIYYQAAPREKQSTATLESEIAKCLNFIETSLTGWGLEKKHVIKQNIFLYATGKSDFYKRKKAVTDTLKDFYKDDYPPTGIIGQPPAGNTLLAAELTVLTSKTQATITRKDTDNIRYIKLDYPGFKKIYTAGITHNENTSNTMQQSQEAFAIMKKILTEEGMEFSQVIRQWNYIENIVGEIADKKETLQNYQVFNDIRSQYYDESDFKNGYPAATGIGMHHGGVILDFIAADIQGEKTVVPIENPIQIDAHHYSQEVLVGKALQGLDKKTTPKFERAKAFKKTNGYYIYISGTAAIKGQKVVFPENAEEQTRVTIENMAQLVSASNLEKHGLTVIPNNTTYSHIRIYVKFEKDLPGIKKICRQHFKDVPSLYLLSDICRGNLLVEIEGAVFVPAPQPG